MNRQTIILVVGLLAALLAGMFIYAYLKKAELNEMAGQTPETPGATEEFMISRVDAKHFYTVPENFPPVHTLAGEIQLPTVCDLLTPNVLLVDDKKRALISFDVINNATETCAPATAPQRFKVGFEGPEDIQMEAYFKGKRIELNLVPAAAGESPADFELYIKG